MRIALGADHAGFEYKDRIAAALRADDHEVLDFGTHSDVPVDYPQYGFAVGEAVASGQADRGIVVCGSSIGISIAANKVPGVRAAVVMEPLTCELARRHNDANVLALSERLTGWEMTQRLVDIFLHTPYEGDTPEGARHKHRVEQLFEFGDTQRARTLKDLERGAVTDAVTPKELL
ncbi:MAG TPA: ribose 5-phosphate isomerase B [Candidatus Baltobacteraceae bacterium]|nr:ribose 5-phosphate isomerase B [Candidatus Baltobacteraceae bacterium]